jgi:spectinomycin phosphotransferase
MLNQHGANWSRVDKESGDSVLQTGFTFKEFGNGFGELCNNLQRTEADDMREKLGIPEDYLRSCLQEHYGLRPISLEFLPLGLDTRSGVYRFMSEHYAHYLLKVRSGPFYEPSCLVPRYLSDQGISSVVAPVLTNSHKLWARFENWTVTVYPFLDGDTSWTGMTNEHWRELGAIFKRIHKVPPPPHSFQSLRKETFDPTEYARWVRVFESQHIYGHRDCDVSRRALRSSWMAHQTTIRTVVISLENLAQALQRRSGLYILCHADLHPANLIRDRAGQVFVIDWDEVMLAPKERDFIYVRGLPADGSEGQETIPFFQGYGQTEIDWIALAYYRWERVVQDLIECARDVFLRDDLGEETKADAAQLFDTIVAGGTDIQAAYAASTHIPSDLISHNQEAF